MRFICKAGGGTFALGRTKVAILLNVEVNKDIEKVLLVMR